MANDDNTPSARVRWARLRFQVLGPLLAAPADDGELKTRIGELAARPWRKLLGQNPFRKLTLDLRG